MVTVKAPAKLNLTLEVLAKRQDGFHEIRSVIQTVNLSDSLRFRLSQNVVFKCDVLDWIPEKSLVTKTASLLQKTTGCSKGATIEISKRIPLVSGLGGDSSDAVATLRGLNKLWELGLSREELLDLAVQLGSDTAFFFYGGTAQVEGRGEIVTLLPSMPHMWVILVVPPVSRLPRKTERLYTSLRATHYTDGQITRKLVEELEAGEEFTPSLLYNTFENVAFAHFSELRVYREHMVKAGASNVQLAGSGPSLFTMIKDRIKAEELYTRLHRQGLETYLTDTLSTMEKIE
ncbi:4-(cytidine 5'-diphospho)-2-C-methyl-D-erythritol kinase [Chloroflexota bacterium]